MRPLKRILANQTVRRFLCWLGSLYIRLVYWTGRWEVLGGDIPTGIWNQGRPFILAFWHGRLMMMPYCWSREKIIHMLISQHRDGQIIARTVSHFGIRTVAGSTTRGGTAALRGMLKSLKKGECVGITPDGPRGPRMRASDGIVNVARLSGVPIVPATYSVNRGRMLSTWDRFLIPRPFSRGVIVWGQPISVHRDTEGEALEAVREKVEAALNAITREADGYCGRAAVEPATLSGEAGS